MPSRRHVIADDLRAQILTGRIKADERLPSEAQLASHYRVSTPTLRNALAALQSEGLVEKIHGKGNFVRYPRRRITYIGGCRPLQTKSSDASALRMSVRTTSLLAHGQLVGLLKVPANSPLTEFVCLNHEGESPHSLARVYIPGGLAPAELPDGPLCCVGFEAKLAALRPPLAEIQERVSARPPTPEEAAVLVLPGDRADALFTTQPLNRKRGEGR